MQLEAQPYVIRKGDSLSAIAHRQGYSDWSVIYRSRCNDALRRGRPNPNLIQPGDRIMLPPRPMMIRLALQQRLMKLQAVEKESRELFDGIVRELESSFAAAEKRGEQVDVTAEVLGILKSVTSLTIKGFQSLAKSGAELDKMNMELAKEALDMPKEKLGDVAMKSFANMLSGPEADTMRQNTAWVFGAVTVQTWLDINSPSYWASTLVNLRSGMSITKAVSTRPVDLHSAAVARITKTREDSLARVQQRIRETQAALARLGPVINTPLPLR